MADNLAVTPGAGATVAAEEISSVKYSLAKLVDATAGSTARTGVAANPLQVSLANTGANATPVKVDNSAVTQPVSAASLPLPTGASTAAKQDTTNGSLSSIDGKTPALGQAVAASSVPVVLPAAQITTLTPPAAITNFANETGGNLASIKTNTDKIPSQGQALAAASLPVVLPATQITTLTPPAAITNFANETGGNLAAVKTNTDKIPSQGNAPMSSSLPVTIAGNQTPIPVVAVNTTVSGTVTNTVTVSGTGGIQSNYTTSVFDGTTALVPKFAKIAAAGSGDNTIVAAVSGKKIRVLAYNFMSAGTVNAKFQSGASGTDLTGLAYMVANTGKVAPYNPVGWFETGVNTLLNLNLSAAIAVGGELVYIEV